MALRRLKNPALPAKEEREYTLIRWSIASRAKTQTTTLKLYKTMNDDKGSVQGTRSSAQILVGVSFSLWRAAFLSNRTGEMEKKHAKAKEFVKKMLEDNAITFADDRNSREWSFNYYIENAEYRLDLLAKQWSAIRLHVKKPLKRSPRKRWDALQERFDQAVDELERKVRNSN